MSRAADIPGDRGGPPGTGTIAVPVAGAGMLPRQAAPRRVFLALLTLGLLLRLAAALYMGDQVQPLPGIWDQLSYDRLAWRVATGHGFSFAEAGWPFTRAEAPTAHWSFLYTGYLAAVYAALGHHPLAARLLQALLAAVLGPWLAWRLGGRLFGPAAGRVAAVASSLYPYFIYYSAALMTEMFTIFAVLALLERALALADDAPGAAVARRRWAVWGLCIGLAALLRQVALLPVPLLALLLLWRRPRRETLTGLAVAAAVALALILPVTARNHRAFGRLVLLNTNAGFAFYWGNHPVHGSDFQPILPPSGPSYQDLVPPELRLLDEAALNDALMARGWGFVAADPWRYLKLSLSRVADYFMFWPSSDSGRLSNLARVLSFGAALPFMLYGLWLSRRDWRRCLPVHLYTGSYILLHLLSWALVRYRLPVDGVLLLFAGLAGDDLLRRFGAAARARRSAAPGVAP